MKNWMTIGQISEATGLSIKALRLYEEKGILKSYTRSENDYRVYTNIELNRAYQIKEFRELGFTISEIAQMIEVDANLNKAELTEFLTLKLNSLILERHHIDDQIKILNSLLTSFESHHELNKPQRRFIMEEVLQKTKQGLLKRGIVTTNALEGIIKEEIILSQVDLYPKMMETLDEVKKVADQLKITLGPGRGTAAASYLLFSKGFNHIFPEKYDLLPDLFYQTKNPVIWIDIPSSKAEIFMTELNKKISVDELKKSKIFIFQCPFLDILDELQNLTGPINFDNYEDDSDEVLTPFRKVELKNIFLFDLPKRSLMNASSEIDFLMQERELKIQVEKFLLNYTVDSVDDILNIMTLSFPIGNKKEMLEMYFNGQSGLLIKDRIPENLHSLFESTKGLLLYREQVIKIISNYTGWSVRDCNTVYFQLKRQVEDEKTLQYKSKVPAGVQDFIKEYIDGTFLKSHMVAMWWFVKRSAIASCLYPKEYQVILEKWNQEHNGGWSDLGFIDKDYRPLAVYW